MSLGSWIFYLCNWGFVGVHTEVHDWIQLELCWHATWEVDIAPYRTIQGESFRCDELQGLVVQHDVTADVINWIPWLHGKFLLVCVET
jgi:hypothetical protein